MADFSFLDDLSDLGSQLYGRAVELGEAAIDSISVDSEAEKVTDKTPVESVNKLPVTNGFFEENKTLIYVGGGIAAVGLLLVLIRK